MTGIDIELLEEEWEEDASPRRRGRRNLSVAARERIEEHDTGRVVAVDKGWLSVLFEGEVVPARYGGAMRGEKVVVGDRVRVRPPARETDVARVLDRLERDTVLTRTADDLDDDERVVVANADQVVVVLAADYLEGGVGFLDRVLVAASAGGLDPLVCLNKIDLVGETAGSDEVDEVVARYEAIGVPVLETSARTGEGLERLRQHLNETWTVLSGHSGVGKSLLFNRLVPDADHEVGELGRYGGRHTTVSSRAMRVRGVDGWLVDTPGVRSFGLGVVAPAELAWHFPELADLECALMDCTHDGEPGCAIEEADIDPARLESYRRLLAALRGEEWSTPEEADEGPPSAI